MGWFDNPRAGTEHVIKEAHMVHGRREWYKLSGFTKRSMVENAVYRYKAIIGPEMRARTLARQRVEHRIGCEILNKMAALGMPDTYCAG